MTDEIHEPNPAAGVPIPDDAPTHDTAGLDPEPEHLATADDPSSAPTTATVPLWWPADDAPATSSDPAGASPPAARRRWITAAVAAVAVAVLSVVGINAVASKATSIDSGGGGFGGRGGFPGGLPPGNGGNRFPGGNGGAGGFPAGGPPGAPGGGNARANPPANAGGGTRGAITSIVNGVIEIAGSSGSTRIVTSATTRVVEQQASGPVTRALGDLRVGTTIDVVGVTSSNGSVDAETIVVLP